MNRCKADKKTQTQHYIYPLYSFYSIIFSDQQLINKHGYKCLIVYLYLTFYNVTEQINKDLYT